MTRSTIIRTSHDLPAIVAASVRPDNTPEIVTRVEGGAEGSRTVVTTIERETTGGLRTTVDDYVVNLTVADDLVQIANQHTTDNTTTKS